MSYKLVCIECGEKMYLSSATSGTAARGIEISADKLAEVKRALDGLSVIDWEFRIDQTTLGCTSQVLDFCERHNDVVAGEEVMEYLTVVWDKMDESAVRELEISTRISKVGAADSESVTVLLYSGVEVHVPRGALYQTMNTHPDLIKVLRWWELTPMQELIEEYPCGCRVMKRFRQGNPPLFFIEGDFVGWSQVSNNSDAYMSKLVIKENCLHKRMVNP